MVRCLNHYAKRARSLGGSKTRLFMNWKGLYKAVSRNAIRRWSRSVLAVSRDAIRRWSRSVLAVSRDAIRRWSRSVLAVSRVAIRRWSRSVLAVSRDAIRGWSWSVLAVSRDAIRRWSRSVLQKAGTDMSIFTLPQPWTYIQVHDHSRRHSANRCRKESRLRILFGPDT